VRVVVDDCKKQTNVANALSYIEQYTSSDGHKIVIKEWDEKWRQQMGLDATYTKGQLTR
jgi:hypothetical protein